MASFLRVNHWSQAVDDVVLEPGGWRFEKRIACG